MWNFSWPIMPCSPDDCRYLFMLKALKLVPFSDPLLVRKAEILIREAITFHIENLQADGQPAPPSV